MRIAAILVAWMACAGALARPADERPPNLVLFLVDDLGWQDASVPFHSQRTPFNDRYRTPNLERLASQGMRFTNGYASAPVCTPSRTSMMTGQSPARTHITYWTLHRDQDTSAAHPTLKPPAWNLNALNADDVTLPRLLRDAGYRTIHVGKAHFGARDTSGADPTNLGFDVNVAGHAAGGPGSYLGRDDFSAAHRGGGRVWDVPGLDEYHGKDVYLTEVLIERALAAVDAAVADGRPFFLNFAPYAVHAPITANARYLAHYEGLDEREAAYATMIETVDAALGRLLDRLDQLGIAERTVVVYTSDNGGLSAHARGGEPHTHNRPLRSGKGSAYEGGIRVPWVVRWPGVTKAASMCDAPIVTHDLFPTLLAIAGATPPLADGRATDGIDFTPLLRGEASAPRRLVWHMPHFWGVKGPGIEPFSAIRDGDWKLLYFHSDRRFELYDLAADIGEERDLAPSEPTRVAALARELADELRTSGAQMSIDARTNTPVPLPDAALPPNDERKPTDDG